MRILATVHQFLPHYTSGTEVLTLGAARALTRRGHEVSILANEPMHDRRTPRPDEIYRADFEDVIVYRKPAATRGFTSFREQYFNGARLSEYQQFIRHIKPDLIHVFHCMGLSTSIISAALTEEVPVVVTATDFWPVCLTAQLRKTTDGSLCDGPDWTAGNCFRCFLCSNPNPSRVQRGLIQLPNVAIWGAYQATRLPLVQRKPFARLLRDIVERPGHFRSLLSQCSKILVPTKLMYRHLRRFGIPDDKLQHAAFGVDTLAAESGANKGCSEALRLGFIGTFSPHKGAHILLEAAKLLQSKRLPRSVLYQLWGDKEHFPEYSCQLDHLAAQNSAVRFMGTFPNQRIGEIFQNIDVLVVPSLWHENAPLVVYSAFAAGTPVVASRVEGLSEIVSDNVNGLLFDRGNPVALAGHIQRLTTDPELVRHLGRNAPRVQGLDDNAFELEQIYHDILRGNNVDASEA